MILSEKKEWNDQYETIWNKMSISDKIPIIETWFDKKKMKKMAKLNKSMGHSHSNSVLLAPKEKGSLIWKFHNATNIEVACNVPGHYQAGMIAKVTIK